MQQFKIFKPSTYGFNYGSINKRSHIPEGVCLNTTCQLNKNLVLFRLKFGAKCPECKELVAFNQQAVRHFKKMRRVK